MYRHGAWIVVLWACLFFLSGCNRKPMVYETLGDMIHHLPLDEEARVFLLESDVPTPYFVLDEDDDGCCMLLRERLLDEVMRYSIDPEVSGDYEDSIIDHFLVEEFPTRFSTVLRKAITETDVVITDIESIGSCGTEMKSIRRQFFLLSYEQVGGAKARVCPAEGTRLKRLGSKQLMAQTDSGISSGWWLRTPNTWYVDMVNVVSQDGGIGGHFTGTQSEDIRMGVRPALRLRADTPIYSGEGGYHIRENGL